MNRFLRFAQGHDSEPRWIRHLIDGYRVKRFAPGWEVRNLRRRAEGRHTEGRHFQLV